MKTDPENFIYDCLTIEDVEKLLNESVECLSNIIKCVPSFAKTLLLEHQWSISEIVKKYHENSSDPLVSKRLMFLWSDNIASNCKTIPFIRS